ncbi:MAG: hypothetical protein GXP26_06735 [Planctomycetes bacterium]|nr:hypothetical protein [Planctomycetota bacterium]
MNGSDTLVINFTNQEDATAKAKWSPHDRLDITKDGLGWDGENSSSFDSWIETKPMPVGFSWRPLTQTGVQVVIDPAPSSFKLPNGQTSTPYPGQVYVRHSPDSKHWSSWQALRHDSAQDRNVGKRTFSGIVAIPHRERLNYQKRLTAYTKRTDVAWASDEEALAFLIVKEQPEFFRDNKSFIGYLQFLFEGSSRGSQRIREFRATAGWGMSGRHMPARDPATEKDRYVPWRFVAPK